MAAASIEGINIKIGADLSDLKEEMGATSDAIKTVGDSAKNDIAAANKPVEKLKDNFAKTAISAEKIAQWSLKFVNAVGGFTGDAITKAFNLSPEAQAAWETVKDAFDNLKAAFGEAFLPELEKVMPIVTDTLNDIATFLREHPDLAESLAAFTVTMLLLASVLSVAAPLAIVFGVSVGTIAAPILIVIGVIILLVAAGLYLKAHWTEISEWFQTTWDNIKTKVETSIDAMKLKFDEFKTKVNTAKANLISFKDSVVNKFETIKTEITDALKGIDLIQAGKDFVSNIAAGIQSEIESIRSSVHEWFMSLIPDGLENLFSSTTANSTAATAADPMGVFGHRAGGGNVFGGSAYWVGELGPEIFVPKTNGYVIPNDEIRDFGPHVTINTGNIYGEAYLRDYVAETMAAAIHRQMRLA